MLHRPQIGGMTLDNFVIDSINRRFSWTTGEIVSNIQNERHLNHTETQCPSQERTMKHQGIQCERIGRMADTRSIGTETEPVIHSAKTGQLLEANPFAQDQVNGLFDNKENEKPKFDSKNFKPPRELNQNNKQDEFEDDWFDEYVEQIMSKN